MADAVFFVSRETFTLFAAGAWAEVALRFADVDTLDTAEAWPARVGFSVTFALITVCESAFLGECAGLREAMLRLFGICYY